MTLLCYQKFSNAQCAITIQNTSQINTICGASSNLYFNANAATNSGNFLNFIWQYNDGVNGWQPIPTYASFYGAFIFSNTNNYLYLNNVNTTILGLQIRLHISDVCGATDTSYVKTIGQGIPSPPTTIYDTINYGNNIVLCGSTRTTTGTYTCNYKNITGCDSTIIHKLFVAGAPVCPISVISFYGNFNRCENSSINTNIYAEADDGNENVYYQWQIFENGAWVNLTNAFNGGNVYNASSQYMSIYNLNANANNIPIRCKLTSSCASVDTTSILNTIHVFSSKRDTINITIPYGNNFLNNCTNLYNLNKDTAISCNFYGASAQGCDSIIYYKIQVLPFGTGCKPIIDSINIPIRVCENTLYKAFVVAHDSNISETLQCQWQYFDGTNWTNIGNTFFNENTTISNVTTNGLQIFTCAFNGNGFMHNKVIRAFISSTCGLTDTMATDSIKIAFPNSTLILDTLIWDTIKANNHQPQPIGGITTQYFLNQQGCDSVVTKNTHVLNLPVSGPVIASEVTNLNAICANTPGTLNLSAFNYNTSNYPGVNVEFQFYINGIWETLFLSSYYNYIYDYTIDPSSAPIHALFNLDNLTLNEADQSITIDSIPTNANGVLIRTRVIDNITNVANFIYGATYTINITGNASTTYVLDTVAMGANGTPFCYNANISGNFVSTCNYTASSGCDSIAKHFVQVIGDAPFGKISSNLTANFEVCTSDTSAELNYTYSVNAFLSSNSLLGDIIYKWQIDTSGNGHFVDCSLFTAPGAYFHNYSSGYSTLTFQCTNAWNHATIRCLQTVSIPAKTIIDSSISAVFNLKLKTKSILYDTISYGNSYTILNKSFSTPGTYSIFAGLNSAGCDSSIDLHLHVLNYPNCDIIIDNISLDNEDTLMCAYHSVNGISIFAQIPNFASTNDSITNGDWQYFDGSNWQSILPTTGDTNKIYIANYQYIEFGNLGKGLQATFSLKNPDFTWDNKLIRCVLKSTCGGIDSSFTFRLHIIAPSFLTLYDTINYGQSITRYFNGTIPQVYKYTGVYNTFLGSNAIGCDSIETLHLYVRNQPNCLIEDYTLLSYHSVCKPTNATTATDPFILTYSANTLGVGVTNYSWQYFDGSNNSFVYFGNTYNGSSITSSTNTDVLYPKISYATLTINDVTNALSGLLIRCVITTNCGDTVYTGSKQLNIQTTPAGINHFDTITFNGNFTMRNDANNFSQTIYDAGTYYFEAVPTIKNEFLDQCGRIDTYYIFQIPPIADTIINIPQLPFSTTALNLFTDNFVNNHSGFPFSNNRDITFKFIAPFCADTIFINRVNTFFASPKIFVLDSNFNIITQSANCNNSGCNDDLYFIPIKNTKYYIVGQEVNSSINYNLNLAIDFVSKTQKVFISACNYAVLPTNDTIYADTIIKKIFVNNLGCDSTSFYLIDIKTPSPITTIFDTACVSYLLPNNTWVNTSNTYTVHLANYKGCDSTIIFHIYIKQSSSSILTVNACNSYTLPWNNVVTASGTYTNLYTNVVGCDSISTFIIALKISSTSTLNLSSNDSIILPNGLKIFKDSVVNILYPKSNGCDSMVTYIIDISEHQLSFVANSITCFGKNNGSIQATLIGGTNPISYTRTPNNGLETSAGNFSNLPAGAYTIMATDATSYTRTSVVTITQPNLLSLNNIASTIPSCNGLSNGILTFNNLGGTMPYTLSTQNNLGTIINGTTIVNLPTNVYIVKVVDANNCSTTKIIPLPQPNKINITGLSKQNVLCNTTATGSITNIITNGGSGSITFSATNGTSIIAPPFTQLTAQVYTLTAKDANNCTRTSVVNITQPNNINITTLVNNPTNGNNGGLVVSSTGGTGTKVATLQSATQTLTGNTFNTLAAGVYTIVATDINGCTATSIVTLQNNSAVVVQFLNENIQEDDYSPIISPNPTNGPLQIAFNNQTKGIAALQIHNAQGALVYKKEIMLKTSNEKITKDFTQWPTDIYLIKIIKANGKTFMYKVEKQ